MLTATLTEAVNSFSQFKVREVIKIIDSIKFEKKLPVEWQFKLKSFQWGELYCSRQVILFTIIA